MYITVLSYEVSMKVRLKSQSVRRLLARRNLSQNALAQRLGTTSGYISQMMSGTRNPSPEMRQRIHDLFSDHQFDDLFVLLDGAEKGRKNEIPQERDW